jgi:hypothetical protein
LRKKSDLKKGERRKETFFYKNTRNVKIRILCTGMDFYCESEKRKQYGWSDFVKQNDATPYKKNNEWLAVKDQNTDTEKQCSLLYELFDKWQSFSSPSKKTRTADAESNVKKDCKTVLNLEYNYEPCDEQFPACFDGNVKLGIVNNKPEEIQNVASFADWSHDFQNDLNKIKGNTILFGLNISSSIKGR